MKAMQFSYCRERGYLQNGNNKLIFIGFFKIQTNIGVS